MKLFIMLVMVALLAALRSAQPVDNLAPEQSDTSGALRFKRNTFPTGYCPSGFSLMGILCFPDEDAEYTDPNSAPDQPDTSGIITGDCPPGNTNIGDICLPSYDYYYTEK